LGREEDKVEEAGEKKEEARAEKEEEREEEVEVVEPIPGLGCWTIGKGCDHLDGSDVVLDRC